MKEQKYYPEGHKSWQDNEKFTKERLESLSISGKIVFAKVLRCDSWHNLYVDLDGITGIIPKGESVLGIESGAIKDIAIISRVNRFICFKVVSLVEEGGKTIAYLSRTLAQKECLAYFLENLRNGDILQSQVTHLEPFGAFVDIGCGIISLINIENISVSRISHPRDRFSIGQDVPVVVKGFDHECSRIFVTHKELLGTWEENASNFFIGETVRGIVRSVESYGIFVELTPNLAGLCEFREGVEVGMNVSVYIKNIIKEKMKIKMLIIGIFDQIPEKNTLRYFISEGHMDSWLYTPEACKFKHIETVFNP